MAGDEQTPSAAAAPDAMVAAAAVERPWWSSIRLYSTPESIEANRISILAVAETIGAMAVYAWIAFNHGTLHLTVACLVAPLVLLRTPESVATGLRWWAKYSRYSDHPSGWALLAVAAVSTIASLALLQLLPDAHKLLKLLLVFAVGTATVTLLPAFAIRVAATLAFLLQSPARTPTAIVQNWYRVAVCTDSAFPPELVPGAARAGTQPGTLSSFLLPTRTLMRSILNLPRTIRELWHEAPPEGEPRLAHRLLALVLFPLPLAIVSVAFLMAALPAWAYRWSIKGTTLVLLPLVVFVREARLNEPKHITGSPTVMTLAAASSAVLIVTFLAAVEHAIGLALPRPDWYAQLLTAVQKNPTASGLFPATGTPFWQISVVLGSAIVVASVMYAGRIHNRDYTRKQKAVLDVAYLALGVVAVALIFSLIYTAAALAIAQHS